MLINPYVERIGGGGLNSGTVLWDNPTGAIPSGGLINLSDSISNYKFIEFVFAYANNNSENLAQTKSVIMRTDEVQKQNGVEEQGKRGFITTGFISGGMNFVRFVKYLSDTVLFISDLAYPMGVNTYNAILVMLTKIIGHN